MLDGAHLQVVQVVDNMVNMVTKMMMVKITPVIAHLQVVQVGNKPPLAGAHDQALLEEENLEIFSKIKRFKMKKNT